MSEVEKYQMACVYKKMLDKPDDFKFLVASGTNNEAGIEIYVGGKKKEVHKRNQDSLERVKKHIESTRLRRI